MGKISSSLQHFNKELCLNLYTFQKVSPWHRFRAHKFNTFVTTSRRSHNIFFEDLLFFLYMLTTVASMLCSLTGLVQLYAPLGHTFFVEIFGIFHFKIWDIQISQILEYSIFHGISQNIPNFIWDIHRLGKSGIW